MLLHNIRCSAPMEEQGCSRGIAGLPQGTCQLMCSRWDTGAGGAGGPCSAGWPCGGAGEDRPSGSLVESSSDVSQPRSCACPTVVLGAVNGSAAEEFVLTFSMSISAFGRPSVLRPGVPGWVLRAGAWYLQGSLGSPGVVLLQPPSPCHLVLSLLDHLHLERRSPCL